MGSVFYPDSGSLKSAGNLRTDMANATVHLFASPTGAPFSPDISLGDIVESAFSGYSDATVASWLPVYENDVSGASFQSGTIQWNYSTPLSGAAVQETVYGGYVLDSSGTLMSIQYLDTPKFMGEDYESVSYNAVFTVFPNS